MGDSVAYRRKNPTYWRDRIRTARAWVDAYKAQPCMDCGHRYPSPVMELDHVRGEKVDAVASMAHLGYGIEKIEAEMQKCDVVCANCHRIRHIERGWSAV